MKLFTVTNVNQAVSEVIPYLLEQGIPEQSRNGRVLVAPGPVITEYTKPCQRVLFSPTRNANPFFHLMESLWMLAGRNDVTWPVYFNKRFNEYSDDGKIFHGAYGYRWRNTFGYDQLRIIADELKRNPTSRRCVLSMWDACAPFGADDLHLAMNGGKDVPCNTHAYFDLRGGALNMTVCNRSNDAIWGAYGANAVHFSILQEYLASWVDAPVGVYRQMSNNLHAYLDIYSEDKLAVLAQEAAATDYYGNYVDESSAIKPLLYSTESVEAFDADLENFLADPVINYKCRYRTSFFSAVAQPMFDAWYTRKNKLGDGFYHIDRIAAPDWRLACLQWAQRIEDKKEGKKNAT